MSWFRREGSLAFSARLGIAAAIMASSQAAAAQLPPGNAAAGQRLAEKWCVQCHVITRSNYAGWTNAPSFPAIADRPNTTRTSLMTIIEGPHLDMLHMPRDPTEAADLAAYIFSLK